MNLDLIRDARCVTVDVSELGIDHIAEELDLNSAQLLHAIINDRFGDTTYLALITVDPPYDSDPDGTTDTYARVCGWALSKRSLMKELFDWFDPTKRTIHQVIKTDDSAYAVVITVPK